MNLSERGPDREPEGASVPQADGDRGVPPEGSVADEGARLALVTALVTLLARVKGHITGPTHKAVEQVLEKAWQQYGVKDKGWDLDVTAWKLQEALK